MIRRPTVLTGVPLIVLCIAGAAFLWFRAQAPAPIRIGVLHSLTGTMAASEKPLIDAVTLAVEEINAAGGLLGHPVQMVVADGRSDWPTFAREAERLITATRVSALFGCWTSACRKAVLPVVERHQHLMFYPVQYEGMEQSRHLLYTGAAPNQQIVPGAHWALQQFGKRVYLIGSDYVFPRTAHLILRDLIAAEAGEVIAEHYVPLGSTDFAAIVEEIRSRRPDVLLNTVNGDSNAALFQALADAGLADLPVLSFSVAEPEMRAWQGTRLHRHYAVWSYFQSLPEPANQRFLAAWHARFGADRLTSDPIESTYNAVHLWAQAVRDAQSSAPHRVNPALLGQSLIAPSGIVSVDGETRHVWKNVRIGHLRPDGQFDLIHVSSRPLRPAPWPHYRSRAEWTALLGAAVP
ncbi:MAG: urea ABC transporter substrate-binding protein [Pseudomonadota bacterium]